MPQSALWYYTRMIPQQLHPFFWDVDPQSFEPLSYPEYTIGRILEKGNSEAVTWLRQHFSEEMIVSVIRRDARLSRKSATFWALVYRVPAEEVAALRQAEQNQN